MSELLNTIKNKDDGLPPLGPPHVKKNPTLKGHIVVDNVTVDFGKGVVAVQNASLDIKPGEFVC